MTQFSDERGAELRQLFFETSQELLQALNQDALSLEKDPTDLETVRSIRRTVHTLKGDAAACGFPRNQANWRTEAEGRARAGDSIGLFHLTGSEVAFTAADAFEAMLVSYRGNLVPPSAEPLRKMIRELGKAAKPEESGQFQPRGGSREGVLRQPGLTLSARRFKTR